MPEGNTHLIKSENAVRQNSDGKAFRDNYTKIFGNKRVEGTAKLKAKNPRECVITCPNARKHGEDGERFRENHDRIFGDKSADDKA
jgi:hypothetical protein